MFYTVGIWCQWCENFFVIDAENKKDKLVFVLGNILKPRLNVMKFFTDVI
jgi:hypothetical protein